MASVGKKYSPMPSFIQCRKPYTNGLIIPVYIVLGHVDITNQIMIGYSEKYKQIDQFIFTSGLSSMCMVACVHA